MKCSAVAKPYAEGPPLHNIPSEKQFTLVLSGQIYFVPGDEDKVIGPGKLIHIPSNTRHRSRPVDGPAT